VKISLLVAAADNDVIGRQGVMLPWHQGADLARFKQLTMGHPVIMGRKTYATIGRALPGRHNIIVTRNQELKAEGCTVVNSLNTALDVAEKDGSDEVFVIGGANVFSQTLSRADKLYLTRVHAHPDGDAYFRYDAADWKELSRQTHPADEKNDYSYTFINLERG
jgi:dihydrofolate reductase